MKIFDFHLHPGYDFHNDELGYEITPELFVQGLAACGVDFCAGSVIHKADTSRPLDEYAEILPRLNAEAYEFLQKYPSLYTPGIHVHPAFVQLSCGEVERYARRGVRLVGELVPYLMAWSGYDDPRLLEILRVAADHQMVLSFHPSKNTAAMETLLKSLPQLNVVIAHLDGYGLYEWSIEMMQKYSNLYFDISAHGASRRGMLADAVRRVGSERILYGSDYPGYSPKPFLDSILQADITDADREAILYKNAARLLHIDL